LRGAHKAVGGRERAKKRKRLFQNLPAVRMRMIVKVTHRTPVYRNGA
jgi:hypothetical protein